MAEIHVCHANNDNKNGGGAYIITRRVENEMRKHGYIFDYITMDEFVTTNNPDLDLLPGSTAHSAHLRRNRWLGHIKLPFYAYSVFKKCRYPIVHIDIDLAGKALLYAIPAKLSGSKVIVHSHSTGIDGDHHFLKGLAHKIGRQILPFFTDGYLACSQNAAKWMFPKRLWKDAYVLFNGTDLNRFYFNEEIRRKWREKLSVDYQLLIGNIGVLSDIKNQLFLVDLIEYLCKKNMNVVLLIVGKYTHEWEEKINKAAKKGKVSDRVILYGYSDDTCELLNAMDIYICPSKIEGFSLTLCEAQATGLPCIRSENVPDEAVISTWITQLSLNESLDVWYSKIQYMAEKYKYDRHLRRVQDSYGLEKMANRLAHFYAQIKHIN